MVEPILLSFEYVKVGNYEGALFELDHAIEEHRWFTAFYITRARIFIATGQFERSLDDLLTAQDLEPENEEVRQMLGQAAQKPQSRQKPRAKPKPRRKRAVEPYSLEDLGRTRSSI